MTTLRTAAKQALEVLVRASSYYDTYAEIAALEAALAEPVQEPVAWRTFDGEGGWDYRDYELNEDYHKQWIDRNGDRYAHWVEPLYNRVQKS